MIETEGEGIAIILYIHGNLFALQEVLKDIKGSFFCLEFLFQILYFDHSLKIDLSESSVILAFVFFIR